ncbi:hypothetical protein KI387_024828, partial [Taxus chinensis]
GPSKEIGDCHSLNGREGLTKDTYAYNMERSEGRPQKWMTNMSDLNLAANNYRSNH